MSNPLRLPGRVPAWLAALLPLLLAAILYRDVVTFGFLSDAELLIAHNAYIKDLRYLWANLTHDYFWSQSRTGIPYWRPFTKGSWVLEYQLFGPWAGGFLLVQLAWFLLGIAGVQVLARRLGARPGFAVLCGVLYALHPAAIDPTCLIMARSDVVSATAVIWTLCGYSLLLAARTRRQRASALSLHLLSLLVGLGSKEQAIAVLPVLVLWALLVIAGRDLAPRAEGEEPRAPASGAARLRPLLLLAPALVLTVLYLALRHLVVRRFAAPAPVYEPLRVLVASSFYLLGLLPLRITSGVRNLGLPEVRDAGNVLVAGLTWLSLTILCAVALLRRQGAILILVGWIVASLLPVLLIANLAVPYASIKVPLADRWLLQAAAASCVLIPLLLQRFDRPLITGVFSCAVLLWGAATFAIAGRSHGVYKDDLALLGLEDRMLEETPEEHRSQEDLCLVGDRNIARAMATKDLQHAIFLFQELPKGCALAGSRLFNYFSLLVGQRRYQEARPLLTRLLEDKALEGRERVPLYYLGGVTLLQQGEIPAAETMLRRAVDMGMAERTCNVFVYLARAAEAQQHAADAAKATLAAQACLARLPPSQRQRPPAPPARSP